MRSMDAALRPLFDVGASEEVQVRSCQWAKYQTIAFWAAQCLLMRP